jgi:hypothetical protein
VSAGGEGFDTDEVVVASRAYLDGWMKRNYGAMGAQVAQLVAEEDYRWGMLALCAITISACGRLPATVPAGVDSREA